MPLSSADLGKLAQRGCSKCLGIGKWERETCGCVYRSIFRACVTKFHNCSLSPDIRFGYNRKDQEYAADFMGIARRALSDDDYRLLVRYLMIGDEPSNAPYFARLRSVQTKLGQAFVETEPYPLYPVRLYFRPGRRIGANVTVSTVAQVA
jgi:hypothetical protein